MARIPDEIQTPARREDLASALSGLRTYLLPKVLVDETRHHRLDKHILLLPHFARFVSRSDGVEAAPKSQVGGIWGTAFAHERVGVELDKELFKGIVEVSGENPSLETEEEGFGDLSSARSEVGTYLFEDLIHESPDEGVAMSSSSMYTGYESSTMCA
jgi:hypothetical protein